MAITCWYTGTAYIALLQAAKIDYFAKEALEGLDICTRAATELEKMWGSARIICEGFKRLRRTYDSQPVEPASDRAGNNDLGSLLAQGPHETYYGQSSLDWTLLFPFVTTSTSRIAELLLNGHGQGKLQTPADSPFREAYWNQYQDLLVPFDHGVFDFVNLNMGF